MKKRFFASLWACLLFIVTVIGCNTQIESFQTPADLPQGRGKVQPKPANLSENIADMPSTPAPVDSFLPGASPRKTPALQNCAGWEGMLISDISALQPFDLSKAGCQIDETSGTFALVQCIPAQKKIPRLNIVITGFVEKTYYNNDMFIGEVVSVVSDKEQKILQAFQLLDDNGEYWNVDLGYKGRLIVEDVNFDGFLDFRILYFAGVYNEFYWYWTWNPEKKVFEEDSELNKLYICYPDFDPKTELIYSWERDGPNYYARMIRFIDRMPTVIEKTFYKFNHETEITHVTKWQLVNDRLCIVEEYDEPGPTAP